MTDLNFYGCLQAGQTEEEHAMRWAINIDWRHITRMCTLRCSDNTIYIRNPEIGQRWKRITTNDNGGKNNENRDFEVTYPDGEMQYHEIKGQYRAFADDPRMGRHTLNILFEVDSGCIYNFTDFADDDKSKGWWREKRRGWFHPGEDKDGNGNPYHADWYHHYMPLYKRENAEILERSRTATARLTEEEIANIFADDRVNPGDNVITEMPGGIMLSLTWQKTMEIISKKFGVQFIKNGTRTRECIKFLVPVDEIIKLGESEINAGTYDGQIAVTPICEVVKKPGSPATGYLWMPDRLYKAVSNVKELDRSETEKIIKNVNNDLPEDVRIPDDRVKTLRGLSVTPAPEKLEKAFGKRTKDDTGAKEEVVIYAPIDPAFFYRRLRRI